MKNGKMILFAVGAVVLVVVAVGVLLFITSRPSPTVQPPNTPRTQNTAVSGNTTAAGEPAQDPLDDSGAEDIPEVPIDSGNDNQEPSEQDPLDDSPEGGTIPNVPPVPEPAAADGVIQLPRTAWTQMETDELYEFCADNRWQISDDGGTVTGTGTYEQAATTLTMSGDGDPRTYEMTWDEAARVLAMKTGETSFNLAYEGESSCP